MNNFIPVTKVVTKRIPTPSGGDTYHTTKEEVTRRVNIRHIVDFGDQEILTTLGIMPVKEDAFQISSLINTYRER